MEFSSQLLIRVLAACSLSACAAPRPAPAPASPAAALAPAVVASADVPPVTPAAPAAPADPCAPLLAAHRATLDGVGADISLWREALDGFGRCLPIEGGGAWVVALSDATFTPTTESEGARVVAQVTVTRVGADGSAARHRWREEWHSHSQPSLRHASIADFDGTGGPEVVIGTFTAVSEDASSQHGRVFTLRGGAVIPYAQADGVDPVEARDVDGDGRPDLITHVPYRGVGDDYPSGFTYEMTGPALVAHALPDGSFSRDDAAAKAFARQACPARNPRVFGASMENAGTQVVCARIWGVPAAAVVRAVNARCASVAEGESGDTPRRPRCGDVRVLAQWARLPPPLTLP